MVGNIVGVIIYGMVATCALGTFTMATTTAILDLMFKDGKCTIESFFQCYFVDDVIIIKIVFDPNYLIFIVYYFSVEV